MKRQLVQLKEVNDEYGNSSPYLIFESAPLAVRNGLRVDPLKVPFDKYLRSLSYSFIEKDAGSFHAYIRALKREAGKIDTESNVGIIVPEKKIASLGFSEEFQDILTLEGFGPATAGFYTNDMRMCLKKCWVNILRR